MKDLLTADQVSWLAKITDSHASAVLPEFQKIYRVVLDGVEYTSAMTPYSLVCIEGHIKSPVEAPPYVSAKILSMLHDTRSRIVVDVLALRSWAGSPDWEDEHVECVACDGNLDYTCEHCKEGALESTCQHCGNSHTCKCNECAGSGTRRCDENETPGWIDNILLPRHLVSQAIYCVGIGDIAITLGAIWDPVYFEKDNVRSIVMPLSQKDLDDDLKKAPRFQSDRSKDDAPDA